MIQCVLSHDPVCTVTQSSVYCHMIKVYLMLACKEDVEEGMAVAVSCSVWTYVWCSVGWVKWSVVKPSNRMTM